jgi:hypothetical protein
MNSHPPQDDRDPLAAYADGDPDAARAAAPREPSEAEWEAVRRRIHRRLALEPARPAFRRAAPWLAATAALAAAAAALAWVAVHLPAPKNPQPERVQAPHAPAPEVALAPAPHEANSDPLAEYDVLPMAKVEEVVLHRVPGDGWLPVGADPLPGALSLATSGEVELDDPNPAWPSVTVAPGAVPMIFAAKPR